MAAVSEPVAPTTVKAPLGFCRSGEVVDDYDNRGLRRAITRPLDSEFARQFEVRECTLNDWSARGRGALDLITMGFEAIDLAPHTALQEVLAAVRSAGAITPGQAKQLRRLLTGRVFPLSRGKCLKFLNIAPEGLIMRQGGPNGLELGHEMSAMNGHGVAAAVHGDQDVFGTPLKQLMRGRAPLLLRHQSPDRRNTLSPLVLVNLWIPLQQITRPLALMDRRTLKGREQQLRYALPTETFLDRSEDMRFNDIWSFLYHEEQAWYFSSDMGHDQAYVFDTLGEPHGATTLPGEAVAEHYYRLLQERLAALDAGESVNDATGEPPELPADTPAALRTAITRIAELAAEEPAAGELDAWRAHAQAALDSVVRKSLEMRVVAVLLPNVWPFNRGALRST
ncbi:MAG: hypothetical protein HKN19_08615 [Halioglobus sp.]|nr:hypothetical protein [Halioglobus sp.]